MRIVSLECAGNNKTKTPVVERELTVHVGDVIPLEFVEDELERSRESLLNTGLFSAVQLELEPVDEATSEYLLRINVVENWYLFPAPFLSLGDRNFNEWLHKYNASLNRVNWGLKLFHFNFTGRNDYLRFSYQRGVQDHFQFQYRLPYFGKQRQFQATVRFETSRSNEVAYATVGNEEMIFSAKQDAPFQKLMSSVNLTYRPALYARHHLIIANHRYSISDSVLHLNPSFFRGSNQSVQYFSIGYRFEGDYRDRRPVATEGFRLQIDLRKDGLGVYNLIDQATLDIAYEQYFKINSQLTAYFAPSFC